MPSHLDLGLLNKSSARIWEFLVVMANGKITSYSYTSKKDGQEITAHKFEVHLVGECSSSYCVGFVKGTATQTKNGFGKVEGRLRLDPVESGV
jgi:hypothetical protein